MSRINLILQAIKEGVSASKIIAKYGKQAYDAAKNIKIKDVKKAYNKVKESAKEYKKTGFKKDLEVDKNLNAPFESWKLALGATGAIGLGETALRFDRRKKKKKLLKKAEQKKGGGSVNSRAIAKKYFKGGLV
jgi:hypothetical protein